MENNEIVSALKQILSSQNPAVKKASLAKKEAVLNAEFKSMLSHGHSGRQRAGAFLNESLKVRQPYVGVTPKLFQDVSEMDSYFAYVEFPEWGATKVPFQGRPATVEANAEVISFNTHSDSLTEYVPYHLVHAAPFSRLNEAKEKCLQAISLSVDSEAISCLEKMASTGFYTALSATALDFVTINKVRGEMAAFELTTKNLLMHPTTYYNLLNLSALNVDQNTLQHILETGHLESIYNIALLTSKLCPKGVVYATSAPKTVGSYVVRFPTQLKVADMSWISKYAVTAYTNYGVVLHNVAGVRKITIAP